MNELDWEPVALAILRSDGVPAEITDETLLEMFKRNTELADQYPHYLKDRSLTLNTRRRAKTAVTSVEQTLSAGESHRA